MTEQAKLRTPTGRPRHLLQKDHGASTLTYAFAVALVALVAVGAITRIGESTEGLFANVADAIRGATAAVGGDGEDDDGLVFAVSPTGDGDCSPGNPCTLATLLASSDYQGTTGGLIRISGTNPITLTDPILLNDAYRLEGVGSAAIEVAGTSTALTILDMGEDSVVTGVDFSQPGGVDFVGGGQPAFTVINIATTATIDDVRISNFDDVSNLIEATVINRVVTLTDVTLEGTGFQFSNFVLDGSTLTASGLDTSGVSLDVSCVAGTCEASVDGGTQSATVLAAPALSVSAVDGALDTTISNVAFSLSGPGLTAISLTTLLPSASQCAVINANSSVGSQTPVIALDGDTVSVAATDATALSAANPGFTIQDTNVSFVGSCP